ncbi:hypothetical protein UlMin_037058 [Ulmus minor]
MHVSGLTGSPSRCCVRVPVSSSDPLYYMVPPGKLILFVSAMNIIYSTGSAQRCNIQKTHLIKCAMDASFGDMVNEPTATFPRINVRDPYKQLGISKEASEEEIQAKPSVDAIESGHDKIIMQKFYERNNPKIDIKKKAREVNQSHVMQAVRNRFRTPAIEFIIKTSVAFTVLGALTILFPTEKCPTLQVAISLIATIYFIHDRLKNKLRAFLYGLSFLLSWV